MIEACRTNEELTTLIKTNALNTLSAHQIEKLQEKQKLCIDTTSLNLDMIFPSSPANLSPADNYQAQPWRPIENDQNANFAGILYALGGQGKPGWHKEWVVLEKDS
ncbi:hypothetical protein HF325_005162 [Metschnikowia pulcherrima]|uniref:Uncharacterized protein n=1 Tax=Metschnikowia pulcherrima TaxID=27326 RepID=A0A8H7GR56_9ASCO|nr:hypothetical protein HF325_005162 [Metschnikowia pulcherrima]